MHAGRRADFFCGVYQLETRFARIKKKEKKKKEEASPQGKNRAMWGEEAKPLKDKT